VPLADPSIIISSFKFEESSIPSNNVELEDDEEEDDDVSSIPGRAKSPREPLLADGDRAEFPPCPRRVPKGDMPCPNEAEGGEKDDPDEKCPSPVGELACCVLLFIIIPMPPFGVGIPTGIGTSPAVVINMVTGPAGPTTTTGVPARALACHIREACVAEDKGGAVCDTVSE
jgi:hypothetical protein